MECERKTIEGVSAVIRSHRENVASCVHRKVAREHMREALSMLGVRPSPALVLDVFEAIIELDGIQGADQIRRLAMQWVKRRQPATLPANLQRAFQPVIETLNSSLTGGGRLQSFSLPPKDKRPGRLSCTALLEHLGESENTTIEEVSFEDTFDSLSMIDARFGTIRSLFSAGLSEPQAFTIGVNFKALYVVGRTRQGQLVGIVSVDKALNK